MERLVIDLVNDTIYYDQRISQSIEARNSLNTYIHEAYKNQESFEEVRDLFSYLTLNTDHLTTNNSTYRELTSTGKLNIFKNQELKISITDYYRLNEEFATNIIEFNLVSTQYLVEVSRIVRNFGKFLRLAKTPYDDPKMFLEGEWKFINEFSSEKFQSLESMVFMYWFRHNEHLNYFQTLKLNSRDLISQINKELNAR